MIYELKIDVLYLSEPISRTILIEDSFTFEQLYDTLIADLKGAGTEKHLFHIVRSNGKGMSGMTLQKRSSGAGLNKDPFIYHDSSESLQLFEEISYEDDVPLRNFFKQIGDVAQLIYFQDVLYEYTLTLKGIVPPTPGISYPICTETPLSLPSEKDLSTGPKGDDASKMNAEERIMMAIDQTPDFVLQQKEFDKKVKKHLKLLMKTLNKGIMTSPSAPKPMRIYSFKITLEGVGVPIWRKIQVKSTITFLELHKIIQVLFHWEDVHLHNFMVQKSDGFRKKDVFIEAVDYEPTFPAFFSHARKTSYSEAKERLNNHFLVEKDQARYTYDFGDDWQHKIVLEEILAPVEGVTYPLCIAAKNDAPYEDSRYDIMSGRLSVRNSNAKEIMSRLNRDLEQMNQQKKWKIVK